MNLVYLSICGALLLAIAIALRSIEQPIDPQTELAQVAVVETVDTVEDDSPKLVEVKGVAELLLSFLSVVLLFLGWFIASRRIP